MISRHGQSVFPATLGVRERLLTFAVGFGVGIGVPLVLGLAFAVAFSQPFMLLFPVPFMLAFGAPYFFRPKGYRVVPCEISVLRAVGPKRIPIASVHIVVSPASRPAGSSVGLARVEGIYGTFGSYWNKGWGHYRVYVTNHENMVELVLDDGSRLIVSPDAPRDFVARVCEIGHECGKEIEFRTPDQK